MQDLNAFHLNDETASWCVRAEEVVQRVPDNCRACLELVREGILLRRRWDRLDRDAPQRRRLLTLLADAQIVCQRRLAESLEQPPDFDLPGAADPRLVEQIVGRLAEDDGYLAELLDDHSLPAETVAFAVECFRDDMHWLGTLVALLDGTGGIDFTGRVLLEQESLQRSTESWPGRHSPSTSAAALPDELRRSAQRLRATAFARQAESLLMQPDPQDLPGWYRAWQAASRLTMRPQGATGAELELAVQAYRARAMNAWGKCLAGLRPRRRSAALRRTADELADAAGEALTFMEDLPLAEAVRSLEILSEDAAVCMKAVQEHGDTELRSLHRRGRRRMKTLAAELLQRRLEWRMEGLFGHTAVALLERTILLLLVLFVVMLATEWAYERNRWPGAAEVIVVCAWLDLGICLVFLSEFSLKFCLARPRLLYLRRNWVTGLLPAIPFGFIVYLAHKPDQVAEAVELFVLLRGLRYLRLPQMARWLRLARPVVRAARLVAFVMQASDRLVRRVAPLLNRNLVLFERAAIEIQQPPYRTALAALRERFQYRASEVISELPPPVRRRLVQARIEDLTAMLSAPQVSLVAPVAKAQVSTTREIPLEAVIARLLAATPAGVSQRVGRGLAQSVARWCRAFDVFGVRRLPLVRDLVEAGHRSSPYGTTAQVANRIGSLLKHALDRVYWVADLYGTLTAPQLVDSIGDWMVKGTGRPARRLLILGLSFLAVTWLARLLSLAGLLPFPDQVKILTQSLERLIGAPLVVLGLLCLLPLLVGLWFRQIAGEATDFCSRVAEAQFLTATKQLKRRFARRHHAELHRRVIAPELEMATGAQRTLDTDTALPPNLSQKEGEPPHADPIRAAVELLFEDYLDGAPFHRSDTKTTTQLLGNLALISLRETRLCYGRRRRKQLRRLDLASTRSWFRGPYLWFHFISRSLAQQTAKLVVDYNAHALPLDRAASAEDHQVRRHIEWLSRRLNKPIERLHLASPFCQRWGALANEPDRPVDAKEDRGGRVFQGNDFTAIHFLCADPELEADVRRRYGDEVAELMHRDRRDNIRRVFRTYPLHRWPKRQRTFNPLRIYSRWFAGGRVLLLPLRMFLWGAILAFRALRLLGRFVRDVLYPTVGDLDAVAEPDPLAVAVRKIHRMRKPVFLECLRMRAEFDPEYLGISLPGSTASARRATTTAAVEEDLALINADPGVRQRFRRLAGRRRRQMLELRRVWRQLDCRHQPGPSLRAMAIAYAIDYRNVRSLLEATRRLQQSFDEVPADPSRPAAALEGSPWSLRALWCRWRYAGKLSRLFEQPAFADYEVPQRKKCRDLLCRRRGPLLEDLRLLTRKDAPADPHHDAHRVLLAIGRDPAPWTRQLVTLRAVQTLSVLDLRTYCDLVAELGEYDGGQLAGCG